MDRIVATTTTEPDPATMARWDALVTRTPGSDVGQLTAWSRVRRIVGFNPLYALVHGGDELVAGAQVLVRSLPMIGEVGYVTYGPVILTDAPAEVEQAIVELLTRIGRRRLRMLFLQPPEGADTVSSGLLCRGFRVSEANIAPVGTVRTDLTKPEEELERGIRSKRLRRRVRSSSLAAKDVRVRLAGEPDLQTFAHLVGRTAAHHGFEAASEDYLRNLYQQLAPGGHVVLFLTEFGGEPVAGQLFTACGGVLKARLTGFDRAKQPPNGTASLQLWTSLRWAKAQGFGWFDFGGLPESSLQAVMNGDDLDDLPGIDKFKIDFGGTPVLYPRAVELINSHLLRGTYDLARRGTAGRRLVGFAQRTLRGSHRRS